MQIDLDSIKAMRVLVSHRALLRRYGLSIGWIWKIAASKTPGHAHVTITLPRPLPILHRILLACVLGSDRTRETLNYIRARRHSRLNILFFETPHGTRTR
ncbi:MAG TPA: hypothetical protein VJ842_14400 [Pyrinomonadaceae bacterium]|nr:hypothetical protein [Pyrinomonadaceae bacterium]